MQCNVFFQNQGIHFIHFALITCVFFSNKELIFFRNPCRFGASNLSMGPVALLMLILCGIAFSGGGLLLSRLLAKRSTNPQKGQAYECGVPTIGKSWIQLNVGYYLFAILFLVFDVELVFLYPWAVVVRETGWVAMVEIVIFLFILFLGFLYAHKKGALKWM